MYKRLLALLCVLLLVAALPVGASAQSEEQALLNQIASDHQRAVTASGHESLAGYCGLLASYQLYYRGINTWLRTADGNDHYDIYSAMGTTDGGYRTKAYSGVDFSIADALNAASRNGTRDVYNILVCFEWTNTEAGAKFGHVVFVYAILDGMVYFTEGFGSSMNSTAGAPICISIADFVAYYAPWTRYEGIVVFGKKDYIDNCTEYSTNLFVEAKEQTALLSQPCTLNSAEAECTQLRTVISGERLHATALYENTVGQYYYRIDDGGQTGYVPASQVQVFRTNFEDVTISDAAVPEALAKGKDFTVKGEVSAPYSGIDAVSVEVLNESGEMVLGYSQTALQTCSLKSGGFNQLLDFASLSEGYYTYGVYADCKNHYLMDDGTVAAYSSRVCLQEAAFRVGDVPAPELAAETAQTRTLRSGWVYEQDTWYYYEEGLPRTGWFYDNGVDYYLQEDGSVTTGWAQINGKMRLFTATGAMRTGWLETENGAVYLMVNGAVAQGWRTIDGKRYYFDDAGILCKDGWLTAQDQRYYLLPDGSAATGWQELAEGTFFFHADGHLLAQLVETDGGKLIRAYENPVGAQADASALLGR